MQMIIHILFYSSADTCIVHLLLELIRILSETKTEKIYFEPNGNWFVCADVTSSIVSILSSIFYCSNYWIEFRIILAEPSLLLLKVFILILFFSLSIFHFIVERNQGKSSHSKHILIINYLMIAEMSHLQLEWTWRENILIPIRV